MPGLYPPVLSSERGPLSVETLRRGLRSDTIDLALPALAGPTA